MTFYISQIIVMIFFISHNNSPCKHGVTKWSSYGVLWLKDTVSLKALILCARRRERGLGQSRGFLILSIYAYFCTSLRRLAEEEELGVDSMCCESLENNLLYPEQYLRKVS